VHTRVVVELVYPDADIETSLPIANADTQTEKLDPRHLFAGAKLYLIGTAHFSQQSQDEVKQVGAHEPIMSMNVFLS
jgi:hypothetical protein